MKVPSLLIIAVLGAIWSAEAANTDSIAARDQVILNDTVTATTVMATKAGYLVVHTITGPTIGRILGFTPVRAGGNTNVSVSLTGAVTEVKKLVFVLREESDGNATLSPKDKLVKVNGRLVTKSITIQ